MRLTLLVSESIRLCWRLSCSCRFLFSCISSRTCSAVVGESSARARDGIPAQKQNAVAQADRATRGVSRRATGMRDSRAYALRRLILCVLAAFWGTKRNCTGGLSHIRTFWRWLNCVLLDSCNGPAISHSEGIQQFSQYKTYVAPATEVLYCLPGVFLANESSANRRSFFWNWRGCCSLQPSAQGQCKGLESDLDSEHWFRNKTAAAGSRGSFARFGVAMGCNEYDRCMRVKGGFVNFGTGDETVHPRHLDIKKDHIKCLFAGHGEGFLAGIGAIRF